MLGESVPKTKSQKTELSVLLLLTLSLNKRAQKKMDKILRGFLWTGIAAAKGSHHYHVNCVRVCRPLRLGVWVFRSLPGRRSASGSDGCGGCTSTPSVLGGVWTCNFPGMSVSCSLHPPRWWFTTEHLPYSGRITGLMVISYHF